MYAFLKLPSLLIHTHKVRKHKHTVIKYPRLCTLTFIIFRQEAHCPTWKWSCSGFLVLMARYNSFSFLFGLSFVFFACISCLFKFLLVFPLLVSFSHALTFALVFSLTVSLCLSLCFSVIFFVFCVFFLDLPFFISCFLINDKLSLRSCVLKTIRRTLLCNFSLSG